MQESIVKIENLSHRYSVQWAIRDISFEIKGRGVQGLLGANGAGKSTLMNILCGVLRQTEGNILIKGIDSREKPVEAKRFIGFLPQKPPLHMDMTVEEYLIYCAYLKMLRGKAVDKAVDVAMGRCGISHFRKRLLRNLSGGYQQRVGIAQAIIHEPALVVLDEPTNGLDPNQIVEIRHLIKEIAQDRTVILSTHILPEIKATCDYIRMVGQGRLVFTGTIDDFDNYISPENIVVTLLASPSHEEIQAIEGITHVEEMGNHRYRLGINGEPDVVERVIEKSVTQGWRMRAIDIEKNSLDTVFAELSKKS